MTIEESPVDVPAAAMAIEAALREASNPERAAAEKRYLKSELDFYGTGVPAARSILSAFLRRNPKLSRIELLQLCESLWQRPMHECRLAAVILLERRPALLTADDVPFLEKLIRESRTWALVDELATGPIDRLARADPDAGAWLDRWAADADFWVRRSSMLALLMPLRAGAGDWDRFTRYAGAMLHEREFFIRKAIGWILRETSKKRPRLVADWLLPRATAASGVTVREAVRYLDASDRDAILAAYRAGRARRSE